MARASIYNWQWVTVLIVAALATIAASVIFFDGFGFLLIFGLPIVIGSFVVLLILSALMGRRSFERAFSLIGAVSVTAAIFVTNGIALSVPLREEAKWLISSARLKETVLAQPDTGSAELKHIEWDGWGMAGQDTSVFLVFDPADKLAAPAAAGLPGKFEGLPCEVWSVHRLESHWYWAVFYTNQFWGACGD